jgi:hypothetical protein
MKQSITSEIYWGINIDVVVVLLNKVDQLSSLTCYN